jgi:hypothetical protein
MDGQDAGGGLILHLGSGMLGSLITLGAAMLRARSLQGSSQEMVRKEVVSTEHCRAVASANSSAHAEVFGRLGALEVKNGVLSTKLEGIEKKLDSLDDKIDRLLNRSHR